eukprot:scaffold326159_cov16-Prasinocladus_malaysianus.AAC.1
MAFIHAFQLLQARHCELLESSLLSKNGFVFSINGNMGNAALLFIGMMIPEAVYGSYFDILDVSTYVRHRGDVV